jgi:hypothetical protein
MYLSTVVNPAVFDKIASQHLLTLWGHCAMLLVGYANLPIYHSGKFEKGLEDHVWVRTTLKQMRMSEKDWSGM